MSKIQTLPGLHDLELSILNFKQFFKEVRILKLNETRKFFFSLAERKAQWDEGGKEEYCWTITLAEVLEEIKICCTLQRKISSV